MSQPPNLLLINCDDLGYGDLGCYGSTVNSTPAIDRLAREGLRFTDFYQASPICSPSRGAMLTGCYPPRISFDDFEGKGVLFPGQGVGLAPGEVTLARLLKEVGYATALVGKWHCGDQPAFLPTRHGFDHYYGLPYSNDMGLMHVRPNARVPLPLLRGESVIQEQPDQTALTERYVQESVEFIRANRQRPWFLYLAHMHVHLPLLVSERFLRGSRNGPYGGAVECIDWATAALLFELERLGIDENTLIVFTSDNGARGDNGGSNAPLRGRKGETWEGGMRLPCLMRWPARLAPGQVRRELFTALDFLPTVAAFAGAHPPTERTLDGLDFSSVLLAAPGEAPLPRETFFYYFKNELCAVRHGRWKLHVWRRGAPAALCELYDLATDRAESTDVAAAHPEVVADLQARLARCREELGDTVTGVAGRGRRPIGRVSDPRPLTRYDPSHPYMIAMYDGEAG
jgi:arylsulfatase A